MLGLLIDTETPRISKEMYKRIDRYLYAIAKHGIESVSIHEEFDSALGLYNHVEGLIAFTKDVDKIRWQEFNNRFRMVPSPLLDIP